MQVALLHSVQNASAKTGGGQIERLQKAPLKLIGYHSNVCDLKTKDRLIIPTHISIKAEYLVKIS